MQQRFRHGAKVSVLIAAYALLGIAFQARAQSAPSPPAPTPKTIHLILREVVASLTDQQYDALSKSVGNDPERLAAAILQSRPRESYSKSAVLKEGATLLVTHTIKLPVPRPSPAVLAKYKIGGMDTGPLVAASYAPHWILQPQAQPDGSIQVKVEYWENDMEIYANHIGLGGAVKVLMPTLTLRSGSTVVALHSDTGGGKQRITLLNAVAADSSL